MPPLPPDVGMYLKVPSVMAALYRLRCQKRKEPGSPKPEMRLAKSQLGRLFLLAMNLGGHAHVCSVHSRLPR